MESIEESVVKAMDGSNIKLYNYLPYILQDIWEFGASPKIITELVRKHKSNLSELKILDLGCGKGAISIQLSKQLKCSCIGIDAVKEFVIEAKKLAKEYCVDHLCKFKVNDIRTENSFNEKFDIIILGAIGPILGDYYETFTKLKSNLKLNGVVIIDDAYFDDYSVKNKLNVIPKSTILSQSKKAGFKLIDETIISERDIKESNENIFNHIEMRCKELAVKEPHNKSLFEDYVKTQAEENEVLEKDVVCSTMVFAN